MRRFLLFLVATSVLAAAPLGEPLIVVQKQTAIRSAKKLYARPVKTLREGDVVYKLCEESPWLRVESGGVQGWLHRTAVSADRNVRLSGDGVGGSVRVTEQSAAAKGFNPQVEKQYRTTHTGLAEAYRILDQVQERKYPEDRVEAFLRSGKLGEFGR